MIQLRSGLILSTILLFACTASDSNNGSLTEGENMGSNYSDSISDPKETIDVPVLKAKIDFEALSQVGQFQDDSDSKMIYELYDQSIDEVEAWTDKLWGRCCTEADMRFTEFLGFNIDVSKDNDQYPLTNATDNLFSTAFVFDKSPQAFFTITFNGKSNMYGRLKNQTGNDLIQETDTIQSSFALSIVNGYAKSEKTFSENARIKTVELWLNGVHMCNTVLIDSPKIQIINGNFSFFKNDVVEIVPVDFYPGSKYEDVCISAFQLSLGYGAHKELDKLSKHWEF